MKPISKIWAYLASLIAVIAAVDPMLLGKVLGNETIAVRVVAACVILAAAAHSLPGSGGGVTQGLTKNIVAPRKDY